MTLVAFTWKESATEPARMASVVEGEARGIVVVALYMRGAAYTCSA
jgi:hypothetical protein